MSKILASEGENLKTRVNNMRAKWGLSQTSLSITSGKTITAADYNTLRNMVQEGKTKSGWGGTVNNTVSVGAIITNVIASLASQADQINNHCACNCNHCTCNCNHCSCTCTSHCSCQDGKNR